MADQYREQYKKETEQIHAPAALIARTKAAMREEEARIRREPAVRTKSPEIDEMPAPVEPATVSAGDSRYAKYFHVRKWAYPLSAAAALLILVSVSLLMRGMNSGDMTSDSPAYEEAAMDTESAAMSGGADPDAGMAIAGSADSEGSVEFAEAASEDEMMSAETDMEAPLEETEDIYESAAADDAAVEKSESKEAEQDGQQRKFSDTEKSLAEAEAEAVPAENGLLSGDAAGAKDITIEEVVKKPDFCGDPDTETRVFKGETFQVAREESGWTAYVEARDGGRYVIRGEAEDVEAFLEAGYRELYSHTR